MYSFSYRIDITVDDVQRMKSLETIGRLRELPMI